MSGGAFDKTVASVQSLREMADWLGATGRQEAADAASRLADLLETPVVSFVTPPCPKCGELMTVITVTGDTSIKGLFLKCEDCGHEIVNTTRGAAAHG